MIRLKRFLSIPVRAACTALVETETMCYYINIQNDSYAMGQECTSWVHSLLNTYTDKHLKFF